MWVGEGGRGAVEAVGVAWHTMVREEVGAGVGEGNNHACVHIYMYTLIKIHSLSRMRDSKRVTKQSGFRQSKS